MIFPFSSLFALGFQSANIQKPNRTQSQDGQKFKPTPPILPPLVQNPKIIPPTLEFTPKDSIVPGYNPTSATLTVQTAIKIAIALQPSLQAAKAQAVQAQGLLIQARSGLYPSATLSGTYNYQTRLGELGLGGNTTSTSGTGTLSGFSSQVQVKQLLFDFGKTADFVEQAAETAKEAKSLQTKAVQDLALSVEQQYYTAVEAEEQVKVDQEDVLVQQQSLDLATGLLKQGQGAPSDVVTAESNLNNSTLVLAQAQATALESKVTLAALIGIDPRTPLSLTDSFSGMTLKAMPSLEASVKTAFQHRPDFLAAQESVRANEAGLRGNKLGLAPSLSLGLSLGSRGATDPFAADTTGASLTVTIPMGDGGLTQGKVEQSQGQLSAALASLKSTELQVISDISQASIGVQSALNRQKIAEAGVKNGIESLKLAQGRYKAGIGLLLDVSTAEATLLTAQSNLLSANAQLATSVAQYRHAIGQP